MINGIAVTGTIVLLFATATILRNYWKDHARRSRRTSRIVPESLQAMVRAVPERRREETPAVYKERHRETSLLPTKEHIVIIDPGENISLGVKYI